METKRGSWLSGPGVPSNAYFKRYESLNDADQEFKGNFRKVIDNLGDANASDVFVTCFSAAKDLLSQWQVYGGSGFAIEFDTAILASRGDAKTAGCKRPYWSTRLYATTRRRIRYLEEVVESTTFQRYRVILE